MFKVILAKLSGFVHISLCRDIYIDQTSRESNNLFGLDAVTLYIG